MFDAPVDTWYLLVGVTATSVLALGLAVSFPTTAPPDAERAATTIDTVTTSPHEATGEQSLDASAVKLGTSRIALRKDGVTARSGLSYGPVTPVRAGTPLATVLTGAPPRRVFPDPAAFQNATAVARNRTAQWEQFEEKLIVRRIVWEDVDVTLVGA